MSLWLKKGVSLKHLSPQTLLAITIVCSIDPGQTIIITSIADPAPGRLPQSLHPTGNAFDFRVEYCEDLDFVWFKSQLHSVFHDTDFDVVFEDTHIHLEYDPK